MANPALSIPFVAPEQAESASWRLRLEAEPAAGTTQASFGDIESMLNRARSGLSARTVQWDHCQCVRITDDGRLVLTLAALVFPSVPELAYRLTLPEGASALPVEPWRNTRQWKFWVNGETTLHLPWMLDESTFLWQPGLDVTDEFCNPIPAPELSHTHATIRLNAESAVYGLLKARGTAVGYRHAFSLEFAKFDNLGRAVSIALDDLPVTAHWVDAQGEPQTSEVTIPIPDCAKDLLETCETGQVISSVRVRHGSTWEIAYSTCDGSILGSRRLKGGSNG